MSEAVAGPSFGTDESEASHGFRRVTSERITVTNAVQSAVGAYLSPAQIEDVTVAVLSALRHER